ncbi:MAG: twin-arginine translocation signal domain-containing protein [Planctomycetaceae bacterium]|nr:twin-arginine translocation signal domain-containing protein [Planctomycetaceae bacterium]
MSHNRRGFLKTAGAAAAMTVMPVAWPQQTSVKTTQQDAAGFFTLGRRGDHWWLITPEGRPFFSMGLNHIDPASLRYPENLDLWRSRYGGSTLRWIKESVAPNLQAWGFNTVGWVQEVTVKQWQHSRAFTVDEYRALDMPFCHLLPFTESHQWEKHTVHYDFRSDDWKEWVDYVARSHCAELAEERNLIGYFYSDCPTWTHDRPFNQWRGPIFDPERLKTAAGRKELSELAHAYYQTTHDAIRRYDTHHLLLGDRYEANAPIATEVMEAALPFVDVLSFQDFRDPLLHLDQWHRKTGKPVLLADAAGVRTPSNTFFKPNNGTWYAKTLAGLFANPGCIGFHLCGAYQRNKARRRGLLDETETPDQPHVDQITAANQRITQRMADLFSRQPGKK